MNNIAEYFDCGSVYLNRDTFVYRVLRFSDLFEKIIPFYQKYSVLVKCVKSRDFQDFVKVAGLIKENKHLTPEGVTLIKEIKAGMNSVRGE